MTNGYYFEDLEHAEQLAGRRTAQQWARREMKTTPRGAVSGGGSRDGGWAKPATGKSRELTGRGDSRTDRRAAGTAFEFPHPRP